MPSIVQLDRVTSSNRFTYMFSNWLHGKYNKQSIGADVQIFLVGFLSATSNDVPQFWQASSSSYSADPIHIGMIYRRRGVQIIDAQLFNNISKDAVHSQLYFHATCPTTNQVETWKPIQKTYFGRSFFLKLSTSIVYINMYSHVKVEVQTHIRKVHTEMTILGLIRKKSYRKVENMIFVFQGT